MGISELCSVIIDWWPQHQLVHFNTKTWYFIEPTKYSKYSWKTCQRGKQNAMLTSLWVWMSIYHWPMLLLAPESSLPVSDPWPGTWEGELCQPQHISPACFSGLAGVLCSCQGEACCWCVESLAEKCCQHPGYTLANCDWTEPHLPAEISTVEAEDNQEEREEQGEEVEYF